MEHAHPELDPVAEHPQIILRSLRLGEPGWGLNRFSIHAASCIDQPLFLGLDLRCCVASSLGANWQRQFSYRLGPRDSCELVEEYHIRRILAPWYAVFRGPCVARLRVSVCLLTEKEMAARPPYGQWQPRMLFSRWFDLIVRADEEARGSSVEPVMPKAGEVTMTGLRWDGTAQAGPQALVTLRNHTAEARHVHVHVDGGSWGDGRRFGLPAGETHTLTVPCGAMALRDAETIPVRVRVLQLPLNLADLDLADEHQNLFMSRYAEAAPEAIVASDRLT